MRRVVNFTGMDGSGKTTALEKIGPILKHRGFSVVEVSARYFDQKVYEFVSVFEREIGKEEEQLFERFMHTLDLHMIISDLSKSDIADVDFVIFDRHFLDKKVFFELRTGREWPEFFERLVTRELYPDTHLYFKVEPRNAAWRLTRQRASLEWKEKREVLERAPRIFEKYLSRESAVRVDIDANLSENQVLNQVMSVLIGAKFD